MKRATRHRQRVAFMWQQLRVLVADRIALLRSASLRWPSSIKQALWSLGRQIRYGIPTMVVIAVLVLAMGGRWRMAGASPPAPAALLAKRMPSLASSRPSSSSSSSSPTSSSSKPLSSPSAATKSAASVSMPAFGAGRPFKKPASALTGKLNLNTATEEQLMMLPTVGPAKAERIVAWRQKNGGFRRIADIRRVKGFGFKTFKRLEPFLAIDGETTLQ